MKKKSKPALVKYERKTTLFRPAKLPLLSVLFQPFSLALFARVFSSPIQEPGVARPVSFRFRREQRKTNEEVYDREEAARAAAFRSGRNLPM